MTTKRTPITRFPIAHEIPPDAAAAFRDMESLPPCTCIWGPNYWNRQECASCDQWWKLHNKLYDALIWHKPWQWPLIDYRRRLGYGRHVLPCAAASGQAQSGVKFWRSESRTLRASVSTGGFIFAWPSVERVAPSARAVPLLARGAATAGASDDEPLPLAESAGAA